MKYCFIQNILTPYRNSLFNRISREHPNFSFEVLYMAKTEPGRSWDIPISDLHYKYSFFKGLHKEIKGFYLHWNWSLIRYVIRQKNETLVCGGSWNDLNIMTICFFKRLGIINSNIVFWAEANYLTSGASKKNKFRDLLRSFIYKTSTKVVVVPGEMSHMSFENWHIKFDNYIYLPNVIEEDAYNGNVVHTYNQSSLPIFIIPVRLIERIKGILNFFTAIGRDNVKKAIFYLCGNGPDEAIIKYFIKKNSYEDNIILKGWCDADQMKIYYQKCDAFILPSYTDASPLTVVEAIYANMPLLLSERCGNHFEAMHEGVNGYLFDPFVPNSIKTAYESLLSRRNEWNIMGTKSRELYDINFSQKKVTDRFVNQLSSIYG